jgi:methylglutaconyl-CoA hydratase
MESTMSDTLEVDFSHGGNVAWIWLTREKVHNALNRGLIEALTATLHALPKQEPARVFVLAGRGASFCAGADLGDMKASASATLSENRADAERIGRLFTAVADCPRPVLVRAHGNIFGGGVGLVAAADIAIGATNAVFAISEVRLGIIPGLISPYLLRRLGDGRARPLMLSGERFDGRRALEIGLLHEAVAPEALDDAVDRRLVELLKAGPEAQTRVKRVLQLNADLPFADVRDRLPDELAEARSGEEAKEGFRAFFEKRKPKWMPELPGE